MAVNASDVVQVLRATGALYAFWLEFHARVTVYPILSAFYGTNLYQFRPYGPVTAETFSGTWGYCGLPPGPWQNLLKPFGPGIGAPWCFKDGCLVWCMLDGTVRGKIWKDGGFWWVTVASREDCRDSAPSLNTAISLLLARDRGNFMPLQHHLTKWQVAFLEGYGWP